MKISNTVHIESFTQQTPITIGLFLQCFDEFFLECYGCDLTLSSRTDCESNLREISVKVDKPITNFESSVLSALIKVDDKSYIDTFLTAVRKANFVVNELPEGISINF